jgi:hypothetical protein
MISRSEGYKVNAILNQNREFPWTKFIAENVTGSHQPLQEDGIWRICGTRSAL